VTNSAGLSPSAQLRAARDFLLERRTDYAAAYAGFAWPRPEEFNFALDWFDEVLTAEHPHRVALRIVDADRSGADYTFTDLTQRSDQLAGWLRGEGVGRGTHVLVLLGNQVELWELTLAAMKLGAVIIPGSTLLSPADLRDRVHRGDVGAVVARSELTGGFHDVHGGYLRIAVGEPVPGWLRYADSATSLDPFSPDGPTKADDPLLLYFTSGTTALPKLVQHTHASYPIGHLSTMYWIGVQPGDMHMNVSSPGWAKHAWSCVFAPWLAGATIAVYNYERFEAAALLDAVRDLEVSTFCAPPTVWRMLVQENLPAWQTSLREVVAAGEPLNPEVIEQVRHAWDLTVRDGYGQTETTLQVGNSPGQPVKVGSMGQPMPGYDITLVDPVSGEEAGEGELCVQLGVSPETRPVPVMDGYQDDAELNRVAFAGGRYHTGDIAERDADGYITFIGRTDDVFKASDYRISPFELESVLIEHPAVAEAAVVPAPDPVRLAVPKAYVTLAPGHAPSRELAGDILRHCRAQVAGYKRVRRLQFADLPKTISGKIRRVELRDAEQKRSGERAEGEFREEDFTDSN
jgi:acetyl-CoA synthetase